MKPRGHVFVVRGDVELIACDWQVVPSGTDTAGRPGEIQGDWLTGEFGELWRSSGLSGMAPNEEQRAVALARDPARRGFIVAHIGDTGEEDPDWFARPIGEIGRLVREAALPAHRGRERVLVALPMLGTRGGGKSNRRGAVMRELLAAADAAAERWDVDYVFVLRDAQGYSAAQRLRADHGLERWEAHLNDRAVKAARRLAKAAREGALVAFIGAGLSAASGLPTWRDLLTSLAEEAGPTRDSTPPFVRGGLHHRQELRIAAAGQPPAYRSGLHAAAQRSVAITSTRSRGHSRVPRLTALRNPELKVGQQLIIATFGWFSTNKTHRYLNVDRPRLDTQSAPTSKCTESSFTEDPDTHRFCCRPHEWAEAEFSDELAERRERGELNPRTWPPVRDADSFEVTASGAPVGDPTSVPAEPVPDGITMDDLE